MGISRRYREQHMLIDGKKISEGLEEKLATELLFSSPKKVCFVIFGGNKATELYVKSKSFVAERLGINVVIEDHSDVVTTEDAVKILAELNKTDVNGIVVQLPIKKGLDTTNVLDAISPEKDIDVLGSVARDSYAKGLIDRTPPVAKAVLEIFEAHHIDLLNKKILIIGNGRLVGKPIHAMLNRMNVAHDVADKETGEEQKMKLLEHADIVISGTGIAHGINPEMVKEGVVLIDAGTSEQEGEMVGDIDPSCEEKASLMTPVPGGVGPVTIISLLRNLL